MDALMTWEMMGGTQFGPKSVQLKGTTGQTGLVLDLVLNLSMRSKYCSLSDLLETMTAKPKQEAITTGNEIVSTHISMRLWIKIETPRKTLNLYNKMSPASHF